MWRTYLAVVEVERALETLIALVNPCGTFLPAKTRIAWREREQDRGGGRARRVGTRSGFGRPGGSGLFSGTIAVGLYTGVLRVLEAQLLTIQCLNSGRVALHDQYYSKSSKMLRIDGRDWGILQERWLHRYLSTC